MDINESLFKTFCLNSNIIREKKLKILMNP